MPPDNQHYGSCILTTDTCHDPHHPLVCHGRLTRIVEADPLILISRELLEELLLHGTAPGVTLHEGPGTTYRDPVLSLTDLKCLSWNLTGWVLTIQTEEKKVVYQIGQYLPDRRCYEATWPD